MAKHRYRITINRIPASREPIVYRFRSTVCTLTCSKDAASVAFEMGPEKTFEDLISFRVDLVKDAMRKMYLLHALRHDSRLRPVRIQVSIDDETREYTKGYPGYPFLYSMLTAKELALPRSWREPDFLTAVLTATKTKSDSDPRYVCLFSFLTGVSKEYRSEAFTCYWTALNALYNHLFELSKPHYARSLGAQSFGELSKRKQKELLDSDAAKIGMLLRLTGSGQSLGSQSERNDNRTQYGKVKSLLRSIPREELPELYRQLSLHRADHDWFPEGPLGEHLKECCDRTGSSCFGFLLFDYAYYIRCNYLHGSKAPILFTAATDPELAAFRALNIFLGEFLKEMIPMIFREDWFTRETYNTIFPGR